MARNKPGKKSKPQPTFRQPAAAIALDAALPNAARPPTPELEHLSDPELPSGPKKTVFEQTLDAMDSEELAALITECHTASLVPKETLEPAVLKRLERMKRQWEGFSARQGVPPELTFHERTFVDKGRAFIRMLLKVTKGSKANGLVAYGTLSQWCATLIQVIGRHCVDDNGDRSGARILQSGLTGSKAGGLFRLIIAEAISLFREFRMDKRIPSKARMGRYEAQRIVEEALRGNTCKEAAITVSLSVAIATVTALRPGALGYSHPEWDGQEGRVGKFMKNKDLQIRRDVDRGEGAFVVTITAEHIKASPASVGRNGTQAFKPLEFMLRSLQEPQNIPFDPVNYIVTLLYHRGELLDYVGKPYEDVLKGTEFNLRIGNPDRPLFRQSAHGGYSMHPDPTRALSAKHINARFSRLAEALGLKPIDGRGISFTGFRAGLAAETGDLYGEDVAAMLMAHQDDEGTARIHYLHGVAAYDWSGIAFGEIKSGNQEHAKRALALNLFRRPATRLAMLKHMEKLAETQEPSNGDDANIPAEEGAAEDDTATVAGAKRKRVSKAPIVSRLARNNLDDEDEQKIVQDIVNEIPEVKGLKERADKAWTAFCDMTAYRPIRGNAWRRFLTMTGDEEVPEDWDASTLPSSWGTEAARQKFCAQYDKINAQYLKALAKHKRKVREKRRKERSEEMERKKEGASLEAAQAAEDSLSRPSHLLSLIIPSISTTASSSSNAAGPSSINGPDSSANAGDLPSANEPVQPEESLLEVETLNTDTECRFFLGVSASGQKIDPSPLHSKIHSMIYSETSSSSSNSGPSSAPAKPTATQSSSKSKGKEKATEEEECQWQDDGDDNATGTFSETEPTPFDERRRKELEKALALGSPAEFRAGWQLFLVDLMASDEQLASQPCPRCPESTTLYGRSKLQRHLNSVHTVLDAHMDGISWEEFVRKVKVGETDRYQCPRCPKVKSWTDPVHVMNHLNLYCKSTRAGPPPAKRREKSLFSSTSSKATDVSMNPPNPPPPRRVLASFRRGNTPGSQPSASTSTSGPQKSGTTQTRRTLCPRPADNPPIAFLASHIDSDCDSVGSKTGYVPPEVEETDDHDWSEEEA